jgi:hypothetical protein
MALIVGVGCTSGSLPSGTTSPTQTLVRSPTAQPTCREWLRAGLGVAGAPIGQKTERWTIEDAKSVYLHLTPPHKGFDIWAFAEAPDFENVDIDSIPVVGRVEGFTLYANRTKSSWQLTAAARDVWVAVHIIPAEAKPTQSRALRWLDGFADYANENPAPPCDVR